MSYLYGIRFKMEENDLIRSLRQVRIHDGVRHTLHSTLLCLGAIHDRLPQHILAGAA